MTHSVQIKSRVGKHGVLLVSVPLAPSDADTDVIITLQTEPARRPWPPRYFEQTYGYMADDPLEVAED